MISQQTLKNIIDVLDTWSNNHNIPKIAVCDLFRKLGAVKGNQSFRDSINALIRATTKEWVLPQIPKMPEN